MADMLPATAAPSPTAAAPRAVSGRSFAAALLVAALLAVLFARLFVPVVTAWDKDSNYSHGYLIPFLCLFLASRSWRRAGPPIAGDRRMAMLNLIPAGVLLLAATVVPWPLITFAAFALTLRGIAVAVGGRGWAAYFTAPILFSFFMFPVPVTWTSTLALWLQDVVSRLSAACLEPFVVCLRTGTVLHILGAPHPLQVGEQCSGLRQLVGFLAFAVLLGLILDRPGWWRLLLAVLAIPFAVGANVVRVLLMCVGSMKFGSEWMDGWLHYAPAAFTLPLGFGLLLATDWLLGRLVPRPATPAEPAVGPLPDVAGRLWPAAGFLGVLLVVQLALLLHLRSAGSESFPPMAAPLAEVPLQVGGWNGFDRPDELARVREKLPYEADDLLLRDYRPAAGGPPVQVYAVYSRQGEDRKHHPEVCIREVSGAPEDLGARAKIDLDADGKRRVQRFVFRTDAVGKTTVYYWHYALLPEARGSYLQTLHQRLGQPAPSLTVQVWAPTADPAAQKSIETEYLPALDLALREGLLPPSAVIDATRLPVALLKE